MKEKDALRPKGHGTGPKKKRKKKILISLVLVLLVLIGGTECGGLSHRG